MCTSFSLLSAYLGHKSLVEAEYYLRLPNRCTPRPCCPICKEGRETEMSKKDFGGVFLGRPPTHKEGVLTEDRDIVPRCAGPPHRFPGKGSRHAVALDDIDALSVEAFLDHPESDRDNGVSTRNQRQAALNSFFSLVRARKPVFYSKITQEMGVPRKHSTPPVMEYLTVAEVEALFSSIDDSTKRAEGEGHDRLPLRGGGARWGAPGFSLLPVEARRHPYVEPHGKGGKTRNVPITRGYEKLIGTYASAFGIGRGEQVLFANRYGQPLTSKGVSYVLEKDLRAAAERMPGIGEERITCHSLRHSREMHLLEVGVNLIYIRDVLGHSSVTTAEMYAKTDPEVKCRLMEEHGANYSVASRYTRSERDDLAQ